MKSKATAREEEVGRFPDLYIDSVKSRMVACCERIARYVMPFGRTFVIALPAVLISRFRSFVAIFNKSPGLDILLDEVYLRLPHMFVPILMDMFNHWFAQGAIPGSVTKGVITLLKKGGKQVWGRGR